MRSSLDGLPIALSEEAAAGCKYCGSKSVKYAGNGTAFWHASVDCCAPALVQQVVWRKEDHEAAIERANAASHPGLADDLGEIEADARREADRVSAALRETVADERELEAAIRRIREVARGEERQLAMDFRHVRSMFAGQRVGADR